MKMTNKEEIIIDGVDVLECEHYEYKSLKDCEMRYPESGDCEIGLLNYLFNGNLDMEKLCKDNPNCYYKQLQKEKFENLNNRQMVESAENLIYENSKLYKNIKEKEQECERLKWYLKEIRYDELKALDIEWDEYETHCIDSEYSNIINLVEEALKERSSEDCRYDR